MNWKYNTSSLSSYLKKSMAVTNWKCAPYFSKHTGVCQKKLGSNTLQYAMNVIFMYNYYSVIICIYIQYYNNCSITYINYIWSILVIWLELRFQDAEVNRSNPGIIMLCP